MIDAANYSATETLRDGRTVEIRAQRPQDREGMHAAIARISSGSLYRRFFAVRREFSEKETDYFLDIDFVNHVALVVVANEAGQPTIVGGGRYVVVEPGQVVKLPSARNLTNINRLSQASFRSRIQFPIIIFEV